MKESRTEVKKSREKKASRKAERNRLSEEKKGSKVGSLRRSERVMMRLYRRCIFEVCVVSVKCRIMKTTD